MPFDYAKLDSSDVSFALLRHHLLFAPTNPERRVFSAQEGLDWAIVMVTHNDSDPDAPLVIIHGSQGRLIRPLLEEALTADRRYLFIVPNQLRPLLKSVLREIEYGRHCLIYSCHSLVLNRDLEDVVRANPLEGCYTYHKQLAGKWASEARVNWQVECFAEVGVYTKKEFRGRGFAKDVVFALTREILASGRWPLYVVSRHNAASIAVCQALGYQYSGKSEYEAVGLYSPHTNRLRSRHRSFDD